MYSFLRQSRTPLFFLPQSGNKLRNEQAPKNKVSGLARFIYFSTCSKKY
jgi:hypothetical protein